MDKLAKREKKVEGKDSEYFLTLNGNCPSETLLPSIVCSLLQCKIPTAWPQQGVLLKLATVFSADLINLRARFAKTK